MNLQKRLMELKEEIEKELCSDLIKRELKLNLFPLEYVYFSVYIHGIESAERAREVMQLMGISSVEAIEAVNMKNLMWLKATDEPTGVHIIAFYPKGE